MTKPSPPSVSSKPPRAVEVAIIGAGAVGAALAARLAEIGYAVLLVDARAKPCAEGRIVALSHASLAGWDLRGAAEAIGIRKVRVDAPEGSLWLRAEDLGLAELGACMALDALVEALRARAARSAQIRWPVRLVALRADEEGVVLCLQGPRGGMHEVHARLVVAADGAGAEVARMAGFRTRLGWLHNRFALAAFVRLSRPPFAAALERFGEDEALALLPWRDGEYALVWTLAPRRALLRLREDADAFCAHLAEAMGPENTAIFGAPRAVRARRGIPLALALSPPAVRGRVWLAGASAHHLHPVAAQGLNLGLRDARTIAEVLDEPWARRDPGARVVGETYAQRRVLDVAGTVAFTESLWLAHAHRSPCLRAVRALALGALRAFPDLRKSLLARLVHA